MLDGIATARQPKADPLQSLRSGYGVRLAKAWARLDPKTQSAMLKLIEESADRGNRMTPSTAEKGSIRYRYYVSCVIAQGRRSGGSIARVSAPEIEAVVVDALQAA